MEQHLERAGRCKTPVCEEWCGRMRPFVWTTIVSVVVCGMPKIGTATLAVSRVRPCARLRGQRPGDLLLLKCKQEAQDDLNRHASLDHTAFDPAVRTTESYLKEVRIQMRLSGRRGANLTLLQHGVTVMRRSGRMRMRKCCRMLSGSLIGNRCSF